MKITKLHDLYFKEYISTDELSTIVHSLATQVKKDLPKDEVPLFVRAHIDIEASEIKDNLEGRVLTHSINITHDKKKTLSDASCRRPEQCTEGKWKTLQFSGNCFMSFAPKVNHKQVRNKD